jgi:hypothetical protein
MTCLKSEKLHVTFMPGLEAGSFEKPRRYTLTHSDATGDLFLSVGPCFNKKQISNLYTRILRDEVLAELTKESGEPLLNVYCHVSGGLVIGGAKWRYGIFCSELALPLEAIRYGDRAFFEANPQLSQTPVHVHFKSNKKEYNKVEEWGTIADYAK